MEIHQRLSGCSYKTGISECFSTTLHKMQGEHRLCKMRKKNMRFHIQVDYGSFETWGFLKSVSQDRNEEGWIVGQDKPAHCKPIRWHLKKITTLTFTMVFGPLFWFWWCVMMSPVGSPGSSGGCAPTGGNGVNTSLLVCLYYKRIMNIRKLILYDHKTHTI